MVAGGFALMDNTVTRNPTNQAFVLNLMDWLARDDAFLAVRSRGLKAAPLDELSDGTRSSVKYANVIGLPMLLTAFGLVRWRLRESRRKKVSL